LAYTEQGGDVLTIEVAAVPGRGELLLTGRLGGHEGVAQAALSYVRALAPQYNIPAEYFSKHDIHIHVPAARCPRRPLGGLPSPQPWPRR